MRRSSLAGIMAIALAASILSAQSAAAGTKVTITGGGFGHGLGMSQYGAYGRALKGKSDNDILTHYYRGAHVHTRHMPRHIRVGLLQSQSIIELSSLSLNSSRGLAKFRVAGDRQSVAKGGPNVTWRVEPSPTGGMHLFKDGNRVERSGNAVFGDPDHPLLFVYHRYGSLAHVIDKGLNYRYGTLKFETYTSSSCTQGFCVRLVNSLSMNQYLYGLGEVPASWPSAALQSQVIAARTYAYKKVETSGQRRYPCDCAVYDSTLDQVFLGDSKRTGSGSYWPNWRKAVTSTKGQVLLYSHDPITALYMSSSGGYTENNENVWGGPPVPYLRGVRDRADAVAANPNHSWTVTMSWDQFATKLSSSYNIGTLTKFRLVKPFGVSGRVTVVKPGIGGGARIVGSRDVVRASGTSVKTALGLRDSLFRVHVAYAVAAPFANAVNRLHHAPGKPDGPSYVVDTRSQRGGVAQNFKHGRLTWNRSLKKVVWQRGPVLRSYNKIGREKSSLGMPISSIWGTRSYKGASYTNGNIYWSQRTGPQSVRGPFLDAYRTYGGPGGPLSLPDGPRRPSKSLPHHGMRQMFVNGALYRGPRKPDVFALWGRVEARYLKMGQARSACGYPTSSMSPVGNGMRISFQHGHMRLTGKGRLAVHCKS